MSDAICPRCGGAIRLIPGATDDAIPEQSPDAIQQQNGRIAQMLLGSTKDGRQPYNQAYPAEFLVFWGIYPRKRDKRKALKAWRNAIRRGAIEEINNGAISYRNDPNRQEEFTKYAEGWLNGDGWLDEPLPARGVDPYTAEQDRLREKKNAEARRFVEEERRVRQQEQS